MTSRVLDRREALDSVLLGGHRGGRRDRAVGFQNSGEARWPIRWKNIDLMRHGILMYAEDMARLRLMNAYKERIPITMQWLMAEASRPLEGLEHAVRGGASDAIVLKEAADVGNLCPIIVEGYVMA